VVISVELENGCQSMLDEGRTEKVSDFSADATAMDFSRYGSHSAVYMANAFLMFLTTKFLFNQTGLPMSRCAVGIYKLECLFELALGIWHLNLNESKRGNVVVANKQPQKESEGKKVVFIL